MSKFQYRFDDKFGVLIKQYFGEITLHDISSSWEFAIQHNLIPEGTKGFIVDYRMARFNIKVSESKKIAAIYKQHPELFKGAKVGVVTNNPRDVVIPILVKEEDDGYLSQPFASFEAALHWVTN